MYIPLAQQALLPYQNTSASSSPFSVTSAHRVLTTLWQHFYAFCQNFAGRDSANGLTKRSSAAQQNITIGVIVGVVTAIFLIAAGAFLYRYRYTVRFHSRKNRRHHRRRSSTSRYSRYSKSSKSSRSSKAGSEAGPPSPSDPAPPEAGAEPTTE